MHYIANLSHAVSQNIVCSSCKLLYQIPHAIEAPDGKARIAAFNVETVKIGNQQRRLKLYCDAPPIFGSRMFILNAKAERKTCKGEYTKNAGL